MLTLEKCREILEKNNQDLSQEEMKIYSDEEIILIRDFLYKMARIYIDYIRDKIGPGVDIKEIIKELKTLREKEGKKKRNTK
jgi:hypothetical protein